jgi:Flp pilus assembly protein TadD/tRNA A-37 threonylcarbamoyl transferase component Bud32
MVGTRVSHYEIVRLIGRGGMGEVYEAVDLDLGRRVALKFIAPELAAEPESFRRFEREARLAAALGHAHIATLYAFERAGDRPFIAMELMTGESLRSRLERGPLAVGAALGVARDVASALAHAHGRDIVHRDIKPENVMFDRDGVAKVTDFGLARATQASRLTTTGTSLGTAAYMAPESVRGEAGKPADLFALGVMLHETLAGRLPFTGDGPLAVLYSIANSDPEPLATARPEAGEAASTLVARLLAKDPAGRPVAAEAARELATLSGEALTPAELAALEPPRAITEEVDVERVEAGLPVPPPQGRVKGRGFDRATRRAAIALTIVLMLLAGIFVLLRRSNRLPPGSGGHPLPVDPVAHAQATALNNRGFALLQKGQLDSARIAFETVLEREPDNAQALVNIGMVFLRQGDDTHAGLHFTQVVQRELGDSTLRAIAHYNLGDIDLRAKAWGSAVTELGAAVALDPATPQYRNNLGYALLQAGRVAEARAVIDSALVRFPGFAALHKNAALADFQEGKLADAEGELRRAITLDPGLGSAFGLLARVHAAQGHFAVALSNWRQFLSLSPEPGERAEVEGDLRARGVLPKP